MIRKHEDGEEEGAGESEGTDLEPEEQERLFCFVGKEKRMKNLIYSWFNVIRWYFFFKIPLYLDMTRPVNHSRHALRLK